MGKSMNSARLWSFGKWSCLLAIRAAARDHGPDTAQEFLHPVLCRRGLREALGGCIPCPAAAADRFPHAAVIAR